MAPVLERKGLLDAPTGAHSLLLLLVEQIVDRYGEPVPPELLQWYVDVNPKSDDSPLPELRAALGPRPRRINLFVALGDLVDLGLLSQQPGGFCITDVGRKTLAEIGGSAGDFRSVI